MKKFIVSALAAAVVAFVVWAAGIRIFVIQPIGALPKGVTVVLMNVKGLNFIDSPDAMCERIGQPSLLCRGMIAGKVAQSGTVLVKLPYSETLYDLSGASKWDR